MNILEEELQSCKTSDAQVQAAMRRVKDMQEIIFKDKEANKLLQSQLRSAKTELDKSQELQLEVMELRQALRNEKSWNSRMANTLHAMEDHIHRRDFEICEDICKRENVKLL